MGIPSRAHFLTPRTICSCAADAQFKNKTRSRRHHTNVPLAGRDVHDHVYLDNCYIGRRRRPSLDSSIRTKGPSLYWLVSCYTALRIQRQHAFPLRRSMYRIAMCERLQRIELLLGADLVEHHTGMDIHIYHGRRRPYEFHQNRSRARQVFRGHKSKGTKTTTESKWAGLSRHAVHGRLNAYHIDLLIRGIHSQV